MAADPSSEGAHVISQLISRLKTMRRPWVSLYRKRTREEPLQSDNLDLRKMYSPEEERMDSKEDEIQFLKRYSLPTPGLRRIMQLADVALAPSSDWGSATGSPVAAAEVGYRKWKLSRMLPGLVLLANNKRSALQSSIKVP
jgi:hypothetical protein